MQLPLTREELKSIPAIKEKFEDDQCGFFSQQEVQMWQDMLCLMENKGLIKDCSTLSGAQYILIGDFTIFEKWIQQENKKAKRISKREWRIAIISAAVGAVIGLIPTIIQWIGGLMNAN